jgi:hypothetical protein
MSINRRKFLELSAAASALGALGTQLPMSEAFAQVGGPTTWVKSVCRYCGTGCGLYVGVQGGKVVSVRGDKENHNRGLLCLKGAVLPQIMERPRPCPATPDGPEERQAGAGHVGRGDEPRRRPVQGGDLAARPRLRRVLRLRAGAHRGDLRREQAVQGRHPHEQRRRQPAPLHGFGRRRLHDHLRQGRADGAVRRHRRRRRVLHHRLEHGRGAPDHLPARSCGGRTSRRERRSSSLDPRGRRRRGSPTCTSRSRPARTWPC